MRIYAQKRIEDVLYEAELEECTTQHIRWVMTKPAAEAGRVWEETRVPRYGVGYALYRVPGLEDLEENRTGVGMRAAALEFLSGRFWELHRALRYVESHREQLREFFRKAPDPQELPPKGEAIQRKRERGKQAMRELKKLRREGLVREETFQLLNQLASGYVRDKDQRLFTIRFERQNQLKSMKAQAGIPPLVDRSII